MGGGAANTAVSELDDRPPTPDPSPPRADARGGRGEKGPSSRAKRSNPSGDTCGAMDCFVAFAPRNDGRDIASTSPRSRGATRPKFCKIFAPPNRGRRESRVSDAPAAARVVVGSTRVSHHEFTGNIRLSPRNGFNGLFRALPGDRALLPPSPLRSLLLRNLTPASRRQDHTTSPSASRAVRYRRIRVHRIPSRVRDDREPPLMWDRMAANITVICQFGKTEYF